MFQWDIRALAVIEALEQQGYRAVLVGGCVRDALLGVTPHDFDVATSALPHEIEAACPNLRCFETGLKHGTVTLLSDGLPVEVTTFRHESGYSDHRHPDGVTFTTSLAEDLSRRDFTINALCVDSSGITDLFGGQEDLHQKIIRCVGNPEQRFQEDALRILRGLRFAAQLEFSIEESTAAAIRRLTPLLHHVSRERIGSEFTRLICSPGAGQVLLDFQETVCDILPALAPTVGFLQHNPHHCYDVYTHCVKAMEQVPPIPALRLAALLHDIGKPSTFTLDDTGVGHFYGHDRAGLPLAESALDSLRLDNTTRKHVLALIEHHHFPLGPDEKTVARRLSKLGEPLYFDLLALQRGDGLACVPDDSGYKFNLDETEAVAKRLLAEGACLSIKDLAVDGRDALNAGFSGPAVGQALNALLAQVTDGALSNDRAALLNYLKELSSN